MTPTNHETALQGMRPLRRFLAEYVLDLRELDLSGFRRWLRVHLTRWQGDPSFALRLSIRDLRCAQPRLAALEQALRRAQTADPLERLYFVTRLRMLWGISSAALARIQHRVAGDPHGAPDDDEYLERLRQWCLTLAEPVESPDMLCRYLEARRGRQILLVQD